MADFLPLSPGGHRYGRFRDNPYHPAWKLHAVTLDRTTLVLPKSARNSQHMGPIRDQGQEGSCTGHAGAGHRELIYNALNQYEPNKTVPVGTINLSPEFVYLCNLIADGNLGTDAGSSMHQTILSLHRAGACLESQMPYSDSQFSTAPTVTQYNEGLAYRTGVYHYLSNLDIMKACIASGFSFIGGITVYTSFEGTWSEPGFMPMPNLATEQVLGGHAQHYMDYDDEIVFPDGNVGGLFTQNSWGTPDVWPMGISAAGRSDGGCYWTPYTFVQGNDPVNGPMMSDCWMSHISGAWI